MCGGAPSTSDGIPLGICDGILNTLSAGVIDILPLETICLAGAEGSAKVGPRLIGVESLWNDGKPCGRSSGNASNAATVSACRANEVTVVTPRRERLFHDELRVLSNMVPPSLIVVAKDTRTAFGGMRKEKKKGHAMRGLYGTFPTLAVSRKTTWAVRSTSESPVWELLASEPQA